MDIAALKLKTSGLFNSEAMKRHRTNLHVFSTEGPALSVTLFSTTCKTVQPHPSSYQYLIKLSGNKKVAMHTANYHVQLTIMRQLCNNLLVQTILPPNSGLVQ